MSMSEVNAEPSIAMQRDPRSILTLRESCKNWQHGTMDEDWFLSTFSVRWVIAAEFVRGLSPFSLGLSGIGKKLPNLAD